MRMPARCTTQLAPRQRGRQSLHDRRSRSRAARFWGKPGRAAAARGERTQATAWMSASSARWRSRMLPTLPLAPVIAMFHAPSGLLAAPVHRCRSPSHAGISQRPSAAESSTSSRAASRREAGRDCRGAPPCTCSFFTLAAQARSSTASSCYPVQDHRVHTAVEAQASWLVLPHVAGPVLCPRTRSS